MMRKTVTGLMLLSGFALAGCSGLVPSEGGPDVYIAVASDHGVDSVSLPHKRAAIAYDPDGCQNWIIDDGVEGYASPRFDPATGMANVCNNHFPPGAVVGNYQSPNAGMRDWVPSRGARSARAN